MTLLVRDEEDILAANFDFHLSQGVDFFIVTDNLSVDGTRDIIEQYVRSGVALYLHESGDDYSQFRWVTKMARMAATTYGADWVINGDADEFWLSEHATGNIKNDLAATAQEVQVLKVPRSNFLPVDESGKGFFAERMIFREKISFNSEGRLLPPKVCHRAMENVEVDQGNHGVMCSGVVPLLCAPSSLRILHFPMRSYQQFENKIIRGGAAYARNEILPTSVGSTWRNLYQLWQSGGLQAYYMENILSVQEQQRRLLSGDLICDETLPEALHNWRNKQVSFSESRSIP